tara:strand:+ start:105 stop:296 length:192 start_codon:yes stop_codon:yes gene_type:complete
LAKKRPVLRRSQDIDFLPKRGQHPTENLWDFTKTVFEIKQNTSLTLASKKKVLEYESRPTSSG